MQTGSLSLTEAALNSDFADIVSQRTGIVQRNVTAAKKALDKGARLTGPAKQTAALADTAEPLGQLVIDSFLLLVTVFRKTGRNHSESVQAAYEVLNRLYAAFKTTGEGATALPVNLTDLFAHKS